MSDTFNCPNCGAPLDYHGSDPMIRCPYCNSSVIVPDNLHARPSFSSQSSNFTLAGLNSGNLGALVQQAQRFREVRDLARAGKVDQALKIYFEITGVSEDQARPAVEALGRGQPIVLSSAGSDFSGFTQQADADASSLQPADAPRSIGAGATLLTCLGVVVALIIVAGVVFAVLPSRGGSLFGALHFGFAQQQLSFGSEGTGPGLFNDVRAVAVNPATGEIFAADYQGGRVQAFDPSGKFVTQWMVGGAKTTISAMSADRAGRVFVVAGGQVLAYDRSGQPLGPVELGNDYMDRIAIAPDDSLVINGNDDNLIRIMRDGKVTVYDKVLTNAGADTDSQMAVAVDKTGILYVLSPENYAVYKFSPDGKFLSSFGSKGDAAGQFDVPEAIAVDGLGRVYVSDFNGILVFDSQGHYLDTIDPDGIAFGLAVDDLNNLYVATNHEKVAKLTVNGTPTPEPGTQARVGTPGPGDYGLGFATQVLAFGGEGTGPGLFKDVRSVAADPASAAIFAGEYDGGRVQAFDPSGQFVTQWVVPGKNATIFSIAVDHKGHVFVVVNGSVLRYDEDGKLQTTWKLGYDNIYNLSAGGDGNLLAVFSGDLLRSMSPDGKVVHEYKDLFTAAAVDSESEPRSAVDGDGNLYLLGSSSGAVFKFSPQGKFIDRFGSRGSAIGQLDSPESIAVDGYGRVFVSDEKGIQVFDAKGNFLHLIGRSSLGAGVVFGMGVDDRNNLYVATNDQKIFKFAIAAP